MSNTWGQGAINNTIGWGQGAKDNRLNWGKSQKTSWAGQTNIIGEPITPSFTNVNSFLFDGVDDYFLGTSTYSELDGQNKATISFWIKPQDNAFRILLHVPKNNTNANGQFLIYQRNGRIHMNIDTSSFYCITPDNTLILNQWQHVMICMDLPSTNEGKIFINGVDKTSAENWYNRTALSTSIGGLYIGEANNGYQSPFYGNIDEVAIWSGTDLRNDVATIYNNGTPTDLNNNGLTAPTTWQRMGDNATWNGATWTMTDVNGGYTNRSINMVEANRTTDVPTIPFSTKSILLDGVDDYVATDIDIDATNGVTVSMWVKAPDSGTAGGWILSRGSTGGSNSTLNFDIKADGRLFHRIFGSSTDTGVRQLMDGNWHHLIILINYSADNITFFKDGSSSGNTLGHGDSYSTINLKSLGNAAGNYYGGFVDEFAIFKSVLSESDIESIYNNGKPNDITSLSPFLWWRCGDGDTSPTLTDNGSGGNDGTMTNFTTFSTDVPT